MDVGAISLVGVSNIRTMLQSKGQSFKTKLGGNVFFEGSESLPQWVVEAASCDVRYKKWR